MLEPVPDYSPMYPYEFRDIAFKLCGKENWAHRLGLRLDISTQNVNRYAKGKKTIPQPIAELLRHMLVVKEAAQPKQRGDA